MNNLKVKSVKLHVGVQIRNVVPLTVDHATHQCTMTLIHGSGVVINADERTYFIPLANIQSLELFPVPPEPKPKANKAKK